MTKAAPKQQFTGSKEGLLRLCGELDLSADAADVCNSGVSVDDQVKMLDALLSCHHDTDEWRTCAEFVEWAVFVYQIEHSLTHKRHTKCTL